jgi:citronellol/citronellal dehydrogenase
MTSRIFQPGLLDGQVAIVSGGGTGLGRATALELAELGTRVVVCGRRLEPLEETAAAAADGRCEAVACDIREEQQVDELVDGVLDRHGRVDLLVNNAGGQYLTAAEDITPKGFRTVIRLNVEGTWLMTHAVATRAMIPEERGGKIVNVTLSPHQGLPGMAHSSAARAAVENLTKVLSIEWARFGIKLTALAAGHFATDTLMTKYPKPVVEGVSGTVPLQRLGRPQEFAWLVAYLASPAGDYLSGAVLTIDGARDNWLGSWPPTGLADAEGKPLSEERSSSDKETNRALGGEPGQAPGPRSPAPPTPEADPPQ